MYLDDVCWTTINVEVNQNKQHQKKKIKKKNEKRNVKRILNTTSLNAYISYITEGDLNQTPHT